MHVSVRRYRDVPSLTELVHAIETEFAPRLGRMPGFVAYYAVASGAAELTTVSVFSTAAMAEDSNEAAAAWMRERDADAPLTPVEVVAGRLAVALPPVRG